MDIARLWPSYAATIITGLSFADVRDRLGNAFEPETAMRTFRASISPRARFLGYVTSGEFAGSYTSLAVRQVRISGRFEAVDGGARVELRVMPSLWGPLVIAIGFVVAQHSCVGAAGPLRRARVDQPGTESTRPQSQHPSSRRRGWCARSREPSTQPLPPELAKTRAPPAPSTQ
jgi:hypothetical protein